MDKNQALHILASTSKGKYREKLLQDDNFRNLVLSSGANVTIYEGDVVEGKSVKDMLKNVYIGLIQRKNRKGNFDGLGALGGLAERTDEEYFRSLSKKEQVELIGFKDDVILKNGEPFLTSDINIIRKNNVLREMREELENLNIFDLTIDSSKLELIPMDKVKDDNYMINIWDGKGECFAITPYCHIYKDECGLIDLINKNAKEQVGGEASEYRKVPLFNALSSYGNVNGKHSLEDGRDATKDYRYPHEYLASWALASKLLDHDNEKMIELAKEVQHSSNHLISFRKIAEATKQSMSDVAKTLCISEETLIDMENSCVDVFSKKIRTMQTYNLKSR